MADEMIHLQPEKAGTEDIKSGECDHEETRRCPYVDVQVLSVLYRRGPVYLVRTETSRRIMESKRDQRFAGRTENPFRYPSLSWTILAIFVLTILNAIDFADGLSRNSLVPDQYTTGSDPNFWGDFAAKGHEKGWDVVESVSETGTLDRYAKSLVLIVGRIVAIQSFASLMSANEDEISNELASRLMSKESVTAIKKIRMILTNVEEHGVVDSFKKYPNQDVWASVYALSRLQRAAIFHDRLYQQSFPVAQDRKLLEDLAYYVVYANVAYGWKMDLAFRRRLHLGGDLQALLRRTGTLAEDVIAAEWESRTHRPGYFIVRDQSKQKIVLCVRGTWTPHDILTDLGCTAEDFDLDPPPVRSLVMSSMLGDLVRSPTKYLWNSSSKRLRAHHGMLESARALLLVVEPILKKELELNPNFSLVLVGHSMGGGVAALLGTLLESTFPNLVVYAYGAPCVAPIDTRPTGDANIISIINEGDPFCCLSLGHVADLSVGLSHLCEDSELRTEILTHTIGRIDEMDRRDLEWCSKTLQTLRGRMTAEKLFPPGRILLLAKPSANQEHEFLLPRLLHVPADQFRDLAISPRMFDLTRHVPSLYESSLKGILDQSKTHRE